MDFLQAFLDEAISNSIVYRKQAEGAMSQLSDSQFFATPSETSNSVAVLVKHMGGNLQSRWRDFLTTDGEKPDRDRDMEFVITESDTRTALMALWDSGWGILLAELRSLNVDDLGNSIEIRGKPMTALQAIVRALTHSAGHASQIVYVAKMLAGDSWKTLSIERGKSVEFNRSLGFDPSA